MSDPLIRLEIAFAESGAMGAQQTVKTATGPVTSGLNLGENPEYVPLIEEACGQALTQALLDNETLRAQVQSLTDQLEACQAQGTALASQAETASAEAAQTKAERERYAAMLEDVGVTVNEMRRALAEAQDKLAKRNDEMLSLTAALAARPAA